jgi:hypothetical protein
MAYASANQCALNACMKKSIRLSTNGLVMPLDFPAEAYESVFSKSLKYVQSANDIYSQFAGAWNAVAYRFLAVADYEREFNSLVSDRSPEPEIRHAQERQLFGFFSNGFSVFEAAFYSAFSLGALVAPIAFPITSAKDQQRISATTTMAALKATFPDDPINNLLGEISDDPAYLEWREIRNVLTHRAAPGRTFFAGIGGLDGLPDQWKIKNITLDADMAPARRAQLSKLLTKFIDAVDVFSRVRL